MAGSVGSGKDIASPSHHIHILRKNTEVHAVVFFSRLLGYKYYDNFFCEDGRSVDGKYYM